MDCSHRYSFGRRDSHVIESWSNVIRGANTIETKNALAPARHDRVPPLAAEESTLRCRLCAAAELRRSVEIFIVQSWTSKRFAIAASSWTELWCRLRTHSLAIVLVWLWPLRCGDDNLPRLQDEVHQRQHRDA